MELGFWKIGCGADEEEGPVGGYPEILLPALELDLSNTRLGGNTKKK